jgi:hypothetical protein
MLRVDALPLPCTSADRRWQLDCSGETRGDGEAGRS